MIELPADCRSRFEPIRTLSSGGFGLTILCNQSSLDRPAVVKILHEGVGRDPDQVHRFLLEAQVTATLAHRSIVQVIDFGYDATAPWIAYEFIDGPTVRDLLRTGPLSLPLALQAAADLASALDVAHHGGVYHRDIKAENVLLAPSGEFKLIDFGIARWHSARGIRTAAGVVYGTPEYMPPEYIAQGLYTAASEIYSLGILLYEMLCGRVPFRRDNVVELLQDHRETCPPDLRTLREDLPAPLLVLIGHTLAKSPEDRLPDCRTLLEEVERVHGALDQPGTSSPRPTRAMERPAPRDPGPRGGTREIAPTFDVAVPPAVATRTLPSTLRSLSFLLAVITGLLLVAGLSMAPGNRSDTHPTIRPNRVEVHLRNALRRVELRGPPEPHELARFELRSSSGLVVSTGTLAPGRGVEVGPLESGTTYHLQVVSAGGEPWETSPPIVTPPEPGVGCVSVFPANRWAELDLDVAGDPELVIGVHPLQDPSRPIILRGKASGGFFRGKIPDLQPGKDHELCIEVIGRSGRLRGIRFVTTAQGYVESEFTEVKSFVEALRTLNDREAVASTVPGLAFLNHPVVPDEVRRYLDWEKRSDPLDVELMQVAARFRDRQLATALLPRGLATGGAMAPVEQLRLLDRLLRSRHPTLDPDKVEPIRFDLRSLSAASLEDDLESFVETCSGLRSPAASRLLDRQLESLDRSCSFPEPLGRESRSESRERALAWMGKASSIECLVGGLCLLGTSGSTADVDHLLGFAEHENPRVQAATLDALARMGTPRSRAAISKLIEKGLMSRFRLWTAVRTRLEDAIPAIERWLSLSRHPQEDPSSQHWTLAANDFIPFVKIFKTDCLLALGAFGKPDSIERVGLRRYLQDFRVEIASACAWTLARLGDRAAGPMIAKHVLPRDRSGLALWALGELREAGARDALLALVRELDGSKTLQSQHLLGLACWALGRISPQDPEGPVGGVNRSGANDDLSRFLAEQATLPTGPSPSLHFLFPNLAYLPTGMHLEPGEMPTFRVVGRWGQRERRAGSIRSEPPLLMGHPLTATVLVGKGRYRIRDHLDLARGAIPWNEPGEMVLSPWWELPPDFDALDLSDAEGALVVAIHRPLPIHPPHEPLPP